MHRDIIPKINMLKISSKLKYLNQSVLILGLLFISNAYSQKTEQGMLFYLSGNQGFKADVSAGGTPDPNFLERVKIIRQGAKGPGFECEDKQLMSYWAPGNIYAERGTLSLFWRSRYPVGKTEFPIFRVSYADHSSWDMVWLRIDYNGNGFDAFVTDVNLARIRISYVMTPFPKPDQWIHLALSWDETIGIRFYINGKLVSKKDSITVLYAGLDQFGPHSRVISPVQVQSAYNFQRGGDIDELKIFDRMLDDVNIAQIANNEIVGEIPKYKRTLSDPRWQAEWNLRYGWNRGGDLPIYLDQSSTRIRKVEIQDVYDLKRWWWKGTDGIRETTWPGVFNRSKLPGRNDYFQLPDWDCYSQSGKSVTFFLPDENWNHIEISGGAWGNISLIMEEKGAPEQILFSRPKGQEKTSTRLPITRHGQKLRFTNVQQEMPLGEFSVYQVDMGTPPAGICSLSYSVTSKINYQSNQVASLVNFVEGRYLPDERSIMMAVPDALIPKKVKSNPSSGLPIVHILIPYDAHLGIKSKVKIDSNYTWANINGGLEGIIIEIPAINVKSPVGGLIPLNIQIKDPIWPARNMLDFSFSVKPGEARTIWLDTRDRILPQNKSLYLTIASACAEFGPKVLEGMQVQLLFKNWKEACREHVRDRFTQARDNYANLVEERADDPRLNSYNRFVADIKDLLRVNPKHYPGQNYWYDIDQQHDKPAFIQPTPPKGVPLWAYRQVESLRYFKRFVVWWLDNRQISNGELGGGLSDDDDLSNCWPGAALMGCEPIRIKDAVLKILDATYDQGMFANGLSTIQTDGLHAHEEGIEAQTQAFLLDYGSPKQLERIMETVRSLDQNILLKNNSGHRHFRSSYFSGTKIAEEEPWLWLLQPQAYLLLQPVITLAEYNGNPRARRLIIEMADGLLAHAKSDSSGKLIIHSEVNFSTDSCRYSPMGNRGMNTNNSGGYSTLHTSLAGLQLLWSVYHMTGDQKYLQPLLDLEGGVLGTLTNDVLNILELKETWGQQIANQITPNSKSDFFRHITWQVTEKKAYLESYYADEIEESALREYINTEGSLWADRVYAANRELQRSRLGGVALVRGAIHSGHAVSWKFKSPASDESVAILVPEAIPSALKIIVYTLDQKSVEATMTAWNIVPGKWEITHGIDTNDDDNIDTVITKKVVELERSRSIQLKFSPRVSTILLLKHLAQGVPYNARPDLGICRDDIEIKGNSLRVSVHNLGSVITPATKVSLVEKENILASLTIPSIEPPLDLSPKVNTINFSIPTGTDISNCEIQIDPENTIAEITRMNNRIELKEVISMEKTSTTNISDQMITLKKLPRFEHIAFNVKEPIEIAKWYCENLGMKVLRKSPPPTNAHFLSDATGNILFELYSNIEAPVPDYSSLSHLSLHLAFMVDDVQAIRNTLISAGAKVVEDVTTIPTGDQILMMRDPWGLAIQFVKRATGMLQAANRRPEHIGLNVSDPLSMTNWYYEYLGVKIVRSGPAPTFTNFFSDGGGNMMMEVYNNTAFPVLDWFTINHLSFHVAFNVEDVRSVRNGLITASATLVEDIRVTNTGDQVLMLRDPWGVPIQFIKRAEPMLK